MDSALLLQRERADYSCARMHVCDSEYVKQDTGPHPKVTARILKNALILGRRNSGILPTFS